MSKPDWTEAPDDATHYDCNADVFCTVDGWWSCKGKFCAMSAHFDWNTPRYTPRPVEPATTTWDGTGLPPRGTICECLFNDGWVKVLVLSVNGYEAWVRRPRGSHIVSKGLGNEFRPIRTKEQQERESAITKARNACPYPGSESTKIDVEALYDAGMLKLPKATA